MVDARPRRHRGLFWAALLAALAALFGGTAFAYVTYAATAGPDGAVRGYFAALVRGDAPAALGFGDLPPGPHDLLTATVLRAQLAIAPLRQVQIVSIERSGNTATVTVRYRLDFAGGAQEVSDDVAVRRHKGSWRLARTAASTALNLTAGSDRATLMGAAVPDGTVLLFPGAVPIGFDTPYLRVATATDSLPLSAPPASDVTVQVSADGRRAVDAALTAALSACVAGGPHADPRCPLPALRAVPGSLRARLTAGAVQRAATVTLAASSAGVITISGTLTLAGTYASLDFDNQPVAKHGSVALPLAATAFATEPIAITWAGGQ